MRDRGSGHVRRELRFDGAGGDLQAAFGGAWGGERAEGVAEGADGWVACEGQLGVDHEDAGAPGGEGCRLRVAVAAVVCGIIVTIEVNKSCFREVELARDELESFGGGVLVCGDQDESEGVAFEFRLGLFV